MKSSINICCLFVVFFFPKCNTEPEHSLEIMKKLGDYPSASAIEYSGNKIYLIGDDASYLLVLDSNLNRIDTIQLYSHSGKRIAKERKADLEAMTMVRRNKESSLVALGSGSGPLRNSGWKIHPLSKLKDSIQLDSFYTRLKKQGIREINIEGACWSPGFFYLVNRGNKAYPVNFLIKTKEEFWKQPEKEFNLVRMGVNLDTNSFQGVSGMDYAYVSDRLVMTVSTEDTRSAYEDGAIGKSYLWIVEFISSKRDWLAINPDQVVDLEAVDNRFKGQKIESVTILDETKKFLTLLLAADNDDGSSTLFKVQIEKE